MHVNSKLKFSNYEFLQQMENTLLQTLQYSAANWHSVVKKCSTVKSQFNESQFNIKSRFKVQNVVTKMEVHIKKSQFSVKSQFKESKCADGGHVLNWDFSVCL